MGAETNIGWTDSTWNPVTGCSKFSEGCRYCYAELLAKRLQRFGLTTYANGFDVTLHESALQIPIGWKTPRTIFVTSMGDLFHDDVPNDFIRKVFDVMQAAHWHQFQVLTKRTERMRELSGSLPLLPNVWMGATVESVDYWHRVDDLRATGAAIKFLSLEPLLGPLPDMDLSGIDWVIVGGESGRTSRPMDASWVADIRDQCCISSVPFFFEQWGGPNKEKSGKLFEGRKWEEMPHLHGTLYDDR